MKWIYALIVSAVLFVGLTFAGKAFFGMGDDMHMGDLECLNHCIDQTVTPSVIPTVLATCVMCFFVFGRILADLQKHHSKYQFVRSYRRRTEPIRLFSLTAYLSSIILRD